MSTHRQQSLNWTLQHVRGLELRDENGKYPRVARRASQPWGTRSPILFIISYTVSNSVRRVIQVDVVDQIQLCDTWGRLKCFFPLLCY